MTKECRILSQGKASYSKDDHVSEDKYWLKAQSAIVFSTELWNKYKKNHTFTCQCDMVSYVDEWLMVVEFWVWNHISKDDLSKVVTGS